MKKICFFGTPAFAVTQLERLVEMDNVDPSLVITQQDAASGRGKRLRPPPVKQYALEHNIPLIQPSSIKKCGRSFIDEVDKYGPFDGAVIVAFGQILPTWLLDYFDGKCINIHASLLPRWRGAAPIHRAIMAGDSQTGICLMKMETGLDTGPVFAQSVIPIKENDTTLSLHEALAKEGADTLSKHLVSILSGQIAPIEQHTTGITYAQKIHKSEALINWNTHTHTLSCHIRGLSPFPGAYTFLNGKRLKILDCTALDKEHSEKPGTILCHSDESLEVACSKGSLLLKAVQLAGKKPQSVPEFLRGTSLKADSFISEE